MPTVKDKRVYDKMNKALLGEDVFSEDNFLKFNERIRPVFELIDSDEEFAGCVREFLVRFKSYFEETERFIDLVGQENVLFYQQDGKWEFKIGSVLKGEGEQSIEKLMNALDKNSEIFDHDEELLTQLLNQLAVVRLLNAAGEKVGIGKIVNMKLSEKQLENLDKIKFNREVGPKERSL